MVMMSLSPLVLLLIVMVLSNMSYACRWNKSPFSNVLFVIVNSWIVIYVAEKYSIDSGLIANLETVVNEVSMKITSRALLIV